jgi:HPt (histidine-containing phosphotransfer) domain-containing protein
VTGVPGPTVDVGRALERVGGERTLLGELVEIFLQDLPDRLRRMRAGAGHGNLLDIQRVAHDLKGSCATLGAQRASALAGTLEAACREARVEAVPLLLASFERELAEVQGFFTGPEWASEPDAAR